MMVGKSQNVWREGREEVGVGVCRDIYWVLVGSSKGASVDSFLSEKAGGQRKDQG